MSHRLDDNQHYDVNDNLAKRNDQSISSSSSNSLSEDENYYSNFLVVPVASSFSLHTDSVYGEAATRHDSISTSARTAITSNIHWQSTVLSRDCISPPNCIDANDNNNYTRSIFGKNIQKKYNVRRGERLETYYNQLVYQGSNSSYVETNACFTPATLSKKKICSETRLANESLSSVLPTPEIISGVDSPPIQLYSTHTASNDIIQFYRNLPIPIQQYQQQNEQQYHQHTRTFMKRLGFFFFPLLLVLIWRACRP